MIIVVKEKAGEDRRRGLRAQLTRGDCTAVIAGLNALWEG